MTRLAAAALLLLCSSCASLAPADGRVRVVVFSAPQCTPCRQMEREVWSDPEVAAWLRAHADLATVDMAQDPQRAAAFGVEGVPAVVVMRGEQELGRVTTRLPVVLVLPWLEVLRTGGVPAVPNSGPLAGSADAVRRASYLALTGTCDEALPILRWAWERRPMDDPAVAALRWHVVADAITDAEMMGCIGAHDTIEALREKAEDRRRTAVDPAQRAEALVDWLGLGTRPVGGADLAP